MADALDRFRIDGIRHNIDFLAAIMQHDRFREGALTTAFIAEEYPDGFEGAPLFSEQIKNALLSVFICALCAGSGIWSFWCHAQL